MFLQRWVLDSIRLHGELFSRQKRFLLFKGPGSFNFFLIGGNVDILKAYLLIPLTPPPLWSYITVPLMLPYSKYSALAGKTSFPHYSPQWYMHRSKRNWMAMGKLTSLVIFSAPLLGVNFLNCGTFWKFTPEVPTNNSAQMADNRLVLWKIFLVSILTACMTIEEVSACTKQGFCNGRLNLLTSVQKNVSRTLVCEIPGIKICLLARNSIPRLI
jgi:hypothetical protein